jgi:hypothetical protein
VVPERPWRETAPDLRNVHGFMSRLLNAPHKDQRSEAARWLGKLDSELALPTLRTAWRQDVSRDVRDEAVLALAKLGDSAILEPLLTILRTGRPDEGKVAVRALGVLGDVRAAGDLVRLCGSAWANLLAVEALAAMGLPALVPLLCHVEQTPELGGRKSLQDFVQKLPAEHVLAAMHTRLGCLTDDDEKARMATALWKLVAGSSSLAPTVAATIRTALPDPKTRAAKALIRSLAKAK